VSEPFALDWWSGEAAADGVRYVAYRGPLWDHDGLRLRFGLDGWQEPVEEVALEPLEDGLAVAELHGLDGRLTLDAVVTDGQRWDNNDDADYRLWIDFEPVDSHVHAAHDGWGRLGAASLHAGRASAGIRTAVLSWKDNRYIDRLAHRTPGYFPLVWVRPHHPRVRAVRHRLAQDHVGLKLHPSEDGYLADDHRLDPYLELAQETAVPVTVHSAPGPSDPDLIRRLAERFPGVAFILYHTYMGMPEGRFRALSHARELDNLYVETSWCSSDFTLAAVEALGPGKVVFGSDASVDGAHHYDQHPPNLEMHDTYKRAMLRVMQHLGTDAGRAVLGGNARHLFRLPGRRPVVPAGSGSPSAADG
jgi:predicted TIM-barrel fold metal-dependent hydrolase